jgi:hypothetical protein
MFVRYRRLRLCAWPVKPTPINRTTIDETAIRNEALCPNLEERERVFGGSGDLQPLDTGA